MKLDHIKKSSRRNNFEKSISIGLPDMKKINLKSSHKCYVKDFCDTTTHEKDFKVVLFYSRNIFNKSSSRKKNY